MSNIARCTYMRCETNGMIGHNFPVTLSELSQLSILWSEFIYPLPNIVNGLATRTNNIGNAPLCNLFGSYGSLLRRVLNILAPSER